MKLRKEDKVIVLRGRDKGKTGVILRVIPKENQVVVENVNVAKRHTKPSQKQPRGGILEITKPIDASKVMVLDPQTGKPARIGYEIKPDGSKERVFKVSPNHDKAAKKAEKTDKAAKKAPAKKADKADKPDKAEPKAGKK
jgi:large subunit ribosomal protein L24